MTLVSRFTPIAITIFFQTCLGIITTAIGTVWLMPDLLEIVLFLFKWIFLIVFGSLFYQEFFPLKNIHPKKPKALGITFFYLISSLVLYFFYWSLIETAF